MRPYDACAKAEKRILENDSDPIPICKMPDRDIWEYNGHNIKEELSNTVQCVAIKVVILTSCVSRKLINFIWL